MILPSNILRVGNKGSIYLNDNCSVYTDFTTLCSSSNTISISFWAKFDSSANRTFVSTGNQSGGDLGYIWFYYELSKDGLVYQVPNGVGRVLFFTNMAGLNKSLWNHYVVVSNYDTGRTEIFVNGVYVNGRTISGAMFPNRLNRILIGRYNPTHVVVPNTNFSDFRIYGRELSVNEIKLLHKGVNISNNSLLARWKFDELDGFTAHDSSGNNLHGNITALGTWSNDKPF